MATKQDTLQVRLSPEQSAQVRALCEELGIPLMVYLKTLIRADFEQRRRDYAPDAKRGGNRK